MKNRQKIILEFPTNLGLKKKDDAFEPYVKYLPGWLESNGFHNALMPIKVFRLNAPEYSLNFDEESKVNNAEQIIDYAIKQSDIIFEKLTEDSFLIILGGDCSVLLGTAIALKRKGNFGLFFLDGHTDYITPEISQTGGVAGMDLAIVTGNGHEKLTNILNCGNYFNEENVFCVGNREFDKNYIEPIIKSKVNYYDLNKTREVGHKKVVDNFLQMIESKKLDGFFYSFRRGCFK